MLDISLLVLATCCDSFFMSVAYGIEGIKIPWKSMIVIAFCGTFFLGISMSLAQVVTWMISPSLGKWLSFTILFLLGFSSVFQHQLKHYVKSHKQPTVTIKFQGISFVIDIFLDEREADVDHSKELSMREAMYLGIALSLDSLASGLAFGMGCSNLTLVLGCSFLLGISMILCGELLGAKLLCHVHQDVTWISGCFLLLLAFLRLR